MKSRKLSFVVAGPALFAAVLVCGTAYSQESQRVACPSPMHVSLKANGPSASTPFAADFPASLQAPSATFGQTAANHVLRHTFTWKPAGECCQYISGTLVLQYKALQGGPAGSSTSANDMVGIYSNGAGVSGAGKNLYTGAVTTGQSGTVTIALTPAMLANNRLSFAVEDDTSVTQASIDVIGCCVNPKR